MKAILVNDDRTLRWDNVPNPILGNDDCLVKIEAGSTTPVLMLTAREEEADKAKAAAKALFVGGGDDTNMPTTEISADKLVDGQIGILSLMVACGLAPSNKQARQLVEQGGVLVNDEKVPSAQFVVTEEMLKEGVKIRKGKKVFHKAVLA